MLVVYGWYGVVVDNLRRKGLNLEVISKTYSFLWKAEGYNQSSIYSLWVYICYLESFSYKVQYLLEFSCFHGRMAEVCTMASFDGCGCGLFILPFFGDI